MSDHEMWVVIPTFNRSADLIACVESLLKAGVDQKKIIIVDNHSKDDTVQTVRETFPDATLFALEKNMGATGASNVGFDFARKKNAKLILRLDSDTLVDEHFAEPLIKKALEDDQIGIIAPKIYYFDPPDEIWYAGADMHPWHFGTINGHRHEKDSPENSLEREVDYAWGAAMLIKSEVLKQTHGFDTDFFVYHEEVDFCLRVKKLGYKLIFIPHSHIWHKVGSSANNAWTAYHWNRSKMLLYRKHAKNGFHLFILTVYALTYAWVSQIFKGKDGTRGPLKDALKGLWAGLIGKSKNEFT